jgi:hypothetical protein
VTKKVYIYTLTNPLNNQIFYVGFANDINKRFHEHLNTNGRKREKNTYKDNVINKILALGLKPEMKIIDKCEHEYNNKLNMCEHERLERYYIQKYRNEGIKLTNLTDGGDGGRTYLKPVYQYSEDGEFLERYDSVNEVANKYKIGADIISKAIDQRGKKSYRGTYLFSSEEKANLFIFKETKKDNIPVIQCLSNGNFIREYKSQKEASTLTNIFQPNINHCLKKERKHAGGFCWEYKNNN